MPSLLIAFIVAATAWTGLSLYLSSRQVAYVRRHRDAVPADFAAGVTLEEHRKAADYTVAHERLARVTPCSTWRFRSPGCWGASIFSTARLPRSCRHRSGWASLPGRDLYHRRLLRLPLDVYETFVLEQRFGFNRTTPLTFIADRLKGWAIALAISVPLLFACLWAMRCFAGLWWLWTWFGLVAMMVAAPTVYVRLIAPRFNRFTPLGEGALRSRIERLMAAAASGRPACSAWTPLGDRRMATRYFIGFGNTKRVVLFDT